MTTVWGAPRNFAAGLKWLYLAPVPKTLLRLRALSRYYGWYGSLLVNIVSEELWMQLADIICCGNLAYTDTLRKTWQDELNSYSVVGTMIATTAITAFTIEQGSMHTLVKWCWTMSLVFGFLCVYISSNVVRRVGRFLRTDDTLHYVRVKKDVVTGRTYHPKRHDNLEKTATLSDALYMRSEYGYVYLPSLSAVIILSISRWSLLLSVHTFLAGLGLMPYFWWKNNAADSENSKGGRLIFWSFIITITLFTLGWMHVRLQHAGEQEDHDVRDRLIVGLESRRQQHLDEQGCEGKEDWIAWRKQVKIAVECPSGPVRDTFSNPEPARKRSTADHPHDLEAGEQTAKPSALKRALSRFPLFGAVNGERVNFGQWIPTWRGPGGSESGGWLKSLRRPSGSHSPAQPVLPDDMSPAVVAEQFLGDVKNEQHINFSDKGVTGADSPAAPMENGTDDMSLAAVCREVAQVAEQYAASARQQARLTALLASHVSGGRQGSSTGAEAEGLKAKVVSRGAGWAPSN